MRTLAIAFAAIALGGSPIRVRERTTKTIYIQPDKDLEWVCFDDLCHLAVRNEGGVWSAKGDLCPQPRFGWGNVVPTGQGLHSLTLEAPLPQ